MNAKQLWQARAKSIRAVIRLKYSLQADEELIRVLAAEKLRFFKSVQRGVVPAPIKLERSLGE